MQPVLNGCVFLRHLQPFIASCVFLTPLQLVPAGCVFPTFLQLVLIDLVYFTPLQPVLNDFVFPTPRQPVLTIFVSLGVCNQFWISLFSYSSSAYSYWSCSLLLCNHFMLDCFCYSSAFFDFLLSCNQTVFLILGNQFVPALFSHSSATISSCLYFSYSAYWLCFLKPLKIIISCWWCLFYSSATISYCLCFVPLCNRSYSWCFSCSSAANSYWLYFLYSAGTSLLLALFFIGWKRDLIKIQEVFCTLKSLANERARINYHSGISVGCRSCCLLLRLLFWFP